MRKSIRSELRMLREMMWHFGLITRCCFCKKPLLEYQSTVYEYPQFGERSLPPVKTKITIHHRNEDHRDNRTSNRKPCHSECHRRFHMKQRHQKAWRMLR